jgi:mycothiol synthase
MAFISRLYTSDADLQQLIGFLTMANAGGLSRGYMHLGDLIWGMYQNTIFDPHANIRVWEDDGELLGFAWFSPPHEVVPQAHPRLWGDAGLLDEMLAWGKHRAREAGRKEGDKQTLQTWCLENDAQRLALLAERGFARDDFHMLHMQRDLSEPIPDLVPPEGAVVRHVGGEDEWQERVETHREVWHPSKVTLEAYRRLRAAPIYRAELDLVAAAPDGTFASYCICWLDSANRTGEFEPVGTRPAFRRRGIGKAVTHEGLRRLREHGAQTALVYSIGHSEPARKLYEAAGFQVVNREYLFVKEL